MYRRAGHQYLLIGLLLFSTASAYAERYGGPCSESAIVTIAFMVTVLIMKVTVFILRYLIVRLGHDTMLRGITGLLVSKYARKSL